MELLVKQFEPYPKGAQLYLFDHEGFGLQDSPGPNPVMYFKQDVLIAVFRCCARWCTSS